MLLSVEWWDPDGRYCVNRKQVIVEIKKDDLTAEEIVEELLRSALSGMRFHSNLVVVVEKREEE